MNERELIKKAKDHLTKNGGFAWSGTTWKDIFGIFDILYLSPGGESRYYQVSTKDHRWSRMKKIDDFRELHNLPNYSYLMLWDYNLNGFTIERL